MTMDLYGHLMDADLWAAAQAIGGILGASETPEQQDKDASYQADRSASVPDGSRRFAARFGPGLWPGPRRQARWAGRGPRWRGQPGQCVATVPVAVKPSHRPRFHGRGRQARRAEGAPLMIVKKSSQRHLKLI